MPTIDADGCPIHAELAGPERAPVLMLSNSLGTTLHMWDAQVPKFTQHFRVLRYDRRGHGQSGVPQGPYSMEQLGRDVLAILNALHLQRVYWCGLSMGGMVGQWLGANAPQRIDRLILSNTACYYPDKTLWHERIKAVSESGIAAIAERSLGAWLSSGFRERDPQTTAHMKAMLLSTPVVGYLGCCAAVRDMDHREILAKITAPTLVIAGRHGPATPVAGNEFIRSRIPGASLTILDAAHIANVEAPDEYADAVLGFLLQR
jgi:3-oxoadipate enol-lactonase